MVRCCSTSQFFQNYPYFSKLFSKLLSDFSKFMIFRPKWNLENKDRLYVEYFELFNNTSVLEHLDEIYQGTVYLNQWHELL